MLNIHQGSEPIEVTRTNMVLYGEVGIGKTSCGFTCDAPICFDFDHGVHRSAYRKNHVIIDTWGDVTQVTEGDLKPYKTVLIDTVGRSLDMLTTHLIMGTPKLRGPAGGLTLQGFGALKEGFRAWLTTMRGFGLDVVMLAHQRDDRKGEENVSRPDAVGASYGEIMKLADACGYMYAVGKQRVIDFTPTDYHVGKDPAGLGLIEVPHYVEQPDFCGQLLTRTKSALGKLSAESKAVTDQVAQVKASIDAAETTDALTDLVDGMAKIEHATARKQSKVLLNRRAKSLGFKWDTKSKRFEPVASNAA